MNIYDISQRAGVSIATVSRVLNKSSHVSEKTRQKVMAVIEEENYSPNVFARGLNLNTMQTIGILYSDASDLYLANAVYHLERCFRRKGYDSLICCCGYELDRRKKYIELMLSKKVDAIVLAGSHFVEEYDEDNDYIRAAAQQLPIAILSGKITGENIVCAYCDDSLAMYEMASRLFALGSKQIMFLYGVASNSIRRKIAGLEEAYTANGQVFREKYAVHCPISDMDPCADYIKAIRQQFNFDAIICTDDAFAVAALRYAQMERVAVPEQLRIIGYNDSILSRCTTPQLSTVDNRTQELCEKLVEMTTDSIAGKAKQTQFSLPGKLIFRGTT